MFNFQFSKSATYSVTTTTTTPTRSTQKSANIPEMRRSTQLPQTKAAKFREALRLEKKQG